MPRGQPPGLRGQAKARGQKRYFTGKSCKHGHICERDTADGNCVQCKAAYKNTDVYRAIRRARYAADAERRRAKSREYGLLHRQRNPNIGSLREQWRRSLKYLAACSCCTEEELRQFFANRPVGYEVDHRTPLCEGGAHCLKNLQYLSFAEHKSKSGREQSKRMAQKRKQRRWLEI